MRYMSAPGEHRRIKRADTESPPTFAEWIGAA